MVELSIIDGNLVIDVQGSHKFFALKSQLTLPLTHIASVRHDPEYADRFWHGVKIAGSDIPGVFAAGTFWSLDGWRFWDVRHPDNAIVLGLKDEGLAEVIVEVEHPAEAVEMIIRAVEDLRRGMGRES